MTNIKVSHSTNDWFTPPRYVEAAREVMGCIDLDPASCEEANRTVKASRYYTKKENGLMQPWYGRIWLNPPYGRTEQGGASLLEHFTRHLIDQYQHGNVVEAIMLIPVNTATRWFDQLWQYPICFPPFRVRFVQAGGGTANDISFGTCFVYLGPQEENFIKIFSHIGQIVRTITPRLSTINLNWTVEEEVTA